jgi:hypothetical protein
MVRTSVLVGILALALMGVGGSFGQDDKDKKEPTARARASLPRNWNKLGLSEDQKQKALSVRGEYQAKIDALQQQIKELQRKESADLQKILTDSQKAKLRELAAPGEDAGKDKDTKKPGGN